MFGKILLDKSTGASTSINTFYNSYKQINTKDEQQGGKILSR